MKEKFETYKKFIDTFYSDDIKKVLEKRFKKDFPIEKIKKMMDEKCSIELYKEDAVKCKAHLIGNPFSLLFNLYVLEDNIKKEYTVPEPISDIIKLIKNDEYRSEVHNINE